MHNLAKSLNLSITKRHACSLACSDAKPAQPRHKRMLNDNFQYSIGPPDSGFSLFLAERTKKIHFIR